MIITLVWVIFLIGSDKILLDSDIDEEDDEEIIIDYTELIDGLTYVRLPLAVVKNSGITTQPLIISSEISDVFSYGEVVNLTDLFTKKNILKIKILKKNKIRKQT